MVGTVRLGYHKLKWILKCLIHTRSVVIYGTTAAIILFVIITYFRRANCLRIAGALVGGFATGLLVILVDSVASSLGW
jgi:hypothetical protein